MAEDEVERKENLYEIASRIDAINRMIGEAGGEVSPEVESALAGLMDDDREFDRKVDVILALIDRNEGDYLTYYGRAKKYAAIARFYRRSTERWEAWIKAAMERAGRTEAGKDIPIRLLKNARPSFSLGPDDKTPPHEYRVVQLLLDKDACYRDWKAGIKLPSTVKVSQGTQIRPVHSPRESDEGRDNV